MADALAQATGRRKTSVARVRIFPGSGAVTVNGVPAPEYFQREVLILEMNSPFEGTETTGKFDVVATCHGGGKRGQAGAMKLGIARALAASTPELRAALKKNGFLSRDSRMKERKKYGQPGARKQFQFSKR